MEGLAARHLHDYVVGKLDQIDREMERLRLSFPRKAIVAWTPGNRGMSMLITNLSKGEERELLETLAERLGVSVSDANVERCSQAGPAFEAKEEKRAVTDEATAF